MAVYFGQLFSLAPGLAFARKLKGFCGLFFRGIIKYEIRMTYEKCIVSETYFVVFRENTREMRKVYSQP